MKVIFDKEYLRDLYNAIELKDIIRRKKIRDIDMLERILAYVTANIGNTYTFEITEVNDKQSGITYDTKTITCTAKIKGLNGDVELKYSPNGTFTNKKPTNSNKKPSGSSSRSSLAKTGDPTNVASVAAIAVAGAVALGYGVRRRRRQQ